MPHSLRVLKEQYETYPYPERHPQDEKKRLITGSPSHLDEINHYLFEGRIHEYTSLRILVAGGGTGDATLMLAQQCQDKGLDANITYMDLSNASLEIARARAQARNLENITFLQGSFLDHCFEKPFDYIDCCGVLHHLPDPKKGLEALEKNLTDQGGMGIMLYAPYGRQGVYELQKAFRRMNADMGLSKKVLANLPSTNGLMRNPWITDHLRSDAGLYDLLLHSQDTPFLVEDVKELIKGSSLNFVTFLEPIAYQPETYLRNKVSIDLDFWEKASLAEELSGNMIKHCFYLKKRRARTAKFSTEARVRFIHLNPQELHTHVKITRQLKVNLSGFNYEVQLPPIAANLIGEMIQDKSIGEVCDALHLRTKIDRDEIYAQCEKLYFILNGLNKMVLTFNGRG